jgi:hypothetical protein
MDEDAPWIAQAASTEIAEPEAARPSDRDARRAAARRALACAVLGVICLGFLFGPIAVAAGHRVRMAMLAEGDTGSASTAHHAIALGRLGMALHLTLAMTALPWALFMLPFFG